MVSWLKRTHSGDTPAFESPITRDATMFTKAFRYASCGHSEESHVPSFSCPQERHRSQKKGKTEDPHLRSLFGRLPVCAAPATSPEILIYPVRTPVSIGSFRPVSDVPSTIPRGTPYLKRRSIRHRPGRYAKQFKAAPTLQYLKELLKI